MISSLFYSSHRKLCSINVKQSMKYKWESLSKTGGEKPKISPSLAIFNSGALRCLRGGGEERKEGRVEERRRKEGWGEGGRD